MAALVILVCVGVPIAARAAGEYPNHPIKLIVPWPPGSNSGNWARVIAEPLGKHLRQPIIVDHRPGATGTIGGKLVADAKPDGYTLLYGITPDQTIAPHVLRNLNHDPRTAFAPISLLLEAPGVLTAHLSSRVATVQDIVAAAKEKPGELMFGSVGRGSQGHLFWEILMKRTGVELTHIPYKGQSELMPDLLAGRISFSFLWPSMAIPHAKAGKLTLVMTTSSKRLADLPQVPTASEAGFPELTAAVWAGILAPAKTPPPVINQLNSAIRHVMQDPAVRAALAKTDAQVRTSTPEEFASLIRSEWERWGKAVKAANVEPE